MQWGFALLNIEKIHEEDLTDEGYLLTPEEREYVQLIVSENAGKDIKKIHKNHHSKNRPLKQEGDPLVEAVAYDLKGRKNPLQYSVIFDDKGQGYSLYRGDILLGKGAFGVVKFGQNIDTGEWVAVKILRGKLDQYMEQEIECLDMRSMFYGFRTRNPSDIFTNPIHLTLLLSENDLIKMRLAKKRLKRLLKGKKVAEHKSKDRPSTQHLKPDPYSLVLPEYTMEQIQQLKSNMEFALQGGEPEPLEPIKNITEKQYLFLKLLVGSTLFDFYHYMQNTIKGLEFSALLQIVESALLELKACHDENIIHRDIKLANMMIEGTDVKLLDYGLAIQVEDPRVETILSSKRNGKTVLHVEGTEGFMAPEVKRGVYSAYSDIYALGKSLKYFFNVVFAISPEEEIIQERLVSLIDAMLESDSAHRPDVDEALDKLQEIKEEYYVVKLNRAIRKGNIEEVEWWAQNEINLNALDDKGQTSLNKAVQYGRLDIVAKLLEYGADPNLGNRFGMTPLLTALICQQEAIAIKIIEAGGDNRAMPMIWTTPLQIAEYKKMDKVADVLKNSLGKKANDLLREPPSQVDNAVSIDTKKLKENIYVLQSIEQEMLQQRETWLPSSHVSKRPCSSRQLCDLSREQQEQYELMKETIQFYDTTQLYGVLKKIRSVPLPSIETDDAQLLKHCDLLLEDELIARGEIQLELSRRNSLDSLKF